MTRLYSGLFFEGSQVNRLELRICTNWPAYNPFSLSYGTNSVNSHSVHYVLEQKITCS